MAKDVKKTTATILKTAENRILVAIDVVDGQISRWVKTPTHFEIDEIVEIEYSIVNKMFKKDETKKSVSFLFVKKPVATDATKAGKVVSWSKSQELQDKLFRKMNNIEFLKAFNYKAFNDGLDKVHSGYFDELEGIQKVMFAKDIEEDFANKKANQLLHNCFYKHEKLTPSEMELVLSVYGKQYVANYKAVAERKAKAAAQAAAHGRKICHEKMAEYQSYINNDFFLKSLVDVGGWTTIQSIECPDDSDCTKIKLVGTDSKKYAIDQLIINLTEDLLNNIKKRYHEREELLNKFVGDWFNKNTKTIETIKVTDGDGRDLRTLKLNGLTLNEFKKTYISVDEALKNLNKITRVAPKNTTTISEEEAEELFSSVFDVEVVEEVAPVTEPQVSVKVTKTLADLEADLETKKAPKAVEKAAKVEVAPVTEPKPAPTGMAIYTEEELAEIEAEESEEEYDDLDEEIDYNEYDKYYDED